MRSTSLIGASYCDEADLELFDLQPTTNHEVHRVTGNIPEMCKFSYCEPCGQVIPPRSEHCEFCKCCILRVDHHCLWMGNSCVGLLNHKFFILYLIYLTLANLLIALLFFKAIFFGEQRGLLNLMERSMSEALVFLLACSLLVGMGIFTAFQITMLLKNKTSFELNLSVTSTPFKHDDPMKNVQMVFGTQRSQWLSPFHDPFPNLKQSGWSQEKVTSPANNILGASSPAGEEYMQCIIPTLKMT